MEERREDEVEPLVRQLLETMTTLAIEDPDGLQKIENAYKAVMETYFNESSPLYKKTVH